MYFLDLNSPKSCNLDENSGIKLRAEITSLIADSAGYFLVLLISIPIRVSANRATEMKSIKLNFGTFPTRISHVSVLPLPNSFRSLLFL